MSAHQRIDRWPLRIADRESNSGGKWQNFTRSTLNLSCFVLGLVAISLATACAQDITDIDRTYPNKVHKSMFNGTWYFRGTVTEVADMAGLLEGIATGMSKIRWRSPSRAARLVDHETAIGMDQEIDDCRRATTVQADGRINIEESFDDECMRRSALEGYVPTKTATVLAGVGCPTNTKAR